MYNITVYMYIQFTCIIIHVHLLIYVYTCTCTRIYEMIIQTTRMCASVATCVECGEEVASTRAGETEGPIIIALQFFSDFLN